MIDEDNIITTGNEYIRNGVAYTRISRILGGFVPDGLLNWYKRTSKAKIDKSRQDTLSYVHTSDIIPESPAPIPEPGTTILVGTGLVGLYLSKKRKK